MALLKVSAANQIQQTRNLTPRSSHLQQRSDITCAYVFRSSAIPYLNRAGQRFNQFLSSADKSSAGIDCDHINQCLQLRLK
jgi:hypothetical protein